MRTTTTQISAVPSKYPEVRLQVLNVVSVFNVGETFGLSSLGTLSFLLKLGGQVE